MIPRHRSGEFFGFWGVFEKFAGIFGLQSLQRPSQ